MHLAIARELVDAEVAAGFPLLGRVPSSNVRRFLDYYRELSAADAAALREALADRGALALRPVHSRALSSDLAPAYERWTNAMLSAQFASSPRHQPLRLAKNIVGAGLAGEWGLDADAAKQLAETKTATATLLRKLIKPLFADRFGLVGRNDRGGNWSYDRAEGSLKVRIDFGGRSDQLRYWVTATDPASGQRVAMATYEGLLGLIGGWDWIVEEEAADAIDLLAELVGLIATLPQRFGGRATQSEAARDPGPRNTS